MYVFDLTCRCSSADRTALSTSTVTGQATRKDSVTCLVNSGLVGERLILNPLNMFVYNKRQKNNDFSNANEKHKQAEGHIETSISYTFRHVI